MRFNSWWIVIAVLGLLFAFQVLFSGGTLSLNEIWILAPFIVTFLQGKYSRRFANEARRDALWQKHKQNWRKDKAGEWRLIEGEAVGGGLMLAGQPREWRQLVENRVFSARLRASAVLHFETMILLMIFFAAHGTPGVSYFLVAAVAAQALVWLWEAAYWRGLPTWFMFARNWPPSPFLIGIIIAVFAVYYFDSTGGNNIALGCKLAAIAVFLCFLTVAWLFMRQRVGTNVNGLHLTGFVGSMVFDPAPAVIGGDFGPVTAVSSADHPASDDLGYKPTA